MLDKFKNPEVKVHYKMYKKGKQWVFAAITTSSLALGLMAFTSVSSSAAEQPAQNISANGTDEDRGSSKSFITTSNSLAPVQLNSNGLLESTMPTANSIQPTILAMAALEEGLLINVNKDNFTDHFTMNGSMRNYPSNGYNSSTGTATLTEDRTSQSGNFTLNTKIDMTQNFTLVGEVYLGKNELNAGASNFANIGADGIGFAFHSGAVNRTGTQGGALGIGGLDDAFGFKLDTFDNGDSSAFNEDPFNAKDAFGAFVYTENRLGKDRNFAVTEASTAQKITDIYNQKEKQPVTFEYKIENGRKIMTVYYAYTANTNGTRNSGGLTWTKDVTDLVKDNVDGYAFNVSGSTGAARNLQQFTIKSFDYKVVSNFTGDFMLDRSEATKLADSVTIGGKPGETKNVSTDINAVIKSLYNQGYDYTNTVKSKVSNNNEYTESKVSQTNGLAILNINVNYDATPSNVRYNFERKAGSVTVIHEYQDRDGNVVTTHTEEPVRVDYNRSHTATPRNVEGYDYVSDGATSATVTRANPTKTIKLIYKAKETMGTVTVNHVDESGKILSPTLVKTDVKYGVPYIAKPVTIEDYELVGVKDNKNTTIELSSKKKTDEITFIYKLKKGTIKVNYVDEDGNPISTQLIEENVVFRTPYTATKKDIANYDYIGVKDNKNTVISLSDKLPNDEITFVYATTQGKVTVEHIYKDVNGVVIPTDTVTDQFDSKYGVVFTPEAKLKADYEIESTTPGTVTLSKENRNQKITIIYKVVAGAEIVVENVYLDEKGNKVNLKDPVTVNGTKGATISPDVKKYDNTLVAADGTEYVYDKTEGTEIVKFTGEKQTITNYYKVVAGGEVVVENVYLDEDGNKVNLKEPVTVKGNKGAAIDPSVKEYAATLEAADGTEYAYEKTEGTEIVKFTGEKQTITNIYKVVAAGDVIVKNVYLNENNEEVSLVDPVVVKGNRGATIDPKVKEYESTLESSAGIEYAYDKTVGTEIVKFTKDTQTITNYYKVVAGGDVIVENVYLDEDGNKVNLKEPVIVKGNKGAVVDSSVKEYANTLAAADGTEYSYDKTTGGNVVKFTDQTQTITNYYKVVAGGEVVVENVYLDEDGNKVNLKEPVTVKGNKGAAIDPKVKEYALTLESSTGVEYAYEKTEGTEIVKFIGEPQTITNYYKVVEGAEITVRNVYKDENGDLVDLISPVPHKGDKGALIDRSIKEVETSYKTANGTEYTYKETNSDQIVKFTAEAQTIINYYEATAAGDVVVKYVGTDPDGQEISLKPSVTASGNVGQVIDEKIKTYEAVLTGPDGIKYKFTKSTGTEITNFVKETQEIIYSYEAIGTITVKHVFLNEDGNEEKDKQLTDTETAWKFGDVYTPTLKTVAGYAMDSISEATVTLTKAKPDQTITIIYKAEATKGKVTVNHIYKDPEGNEIAGERKTITATPKFGDLYKVSTILKADYEVESISAETVTLTKANPTAEVNVVYKIVAGADVIVRNVYKDENGNLVDLIDPKSHQGTKGALIGHTVKEAAPSYKVGNGTVYDYVGTNSDQIVKFTAESQTIINEYEATPAGGLIVKYLAKGADGKEIAVKASVNKSGKVGELVDSTLKNTEGTLTGPDGIQYKFVNSTGLDIESFTKETQEIIHNYEAIQAGDVTVKHIYLDDDSNPVTLEEAALKGKVGEVVDSKLIESKASITKDGVVYNYLRTNRNLVLKFAIDPQTITHVYAAAEQEPAIFSKLKVVYKTVGGEILATNETSGEKGSKLPVIEKKKFEGFTFKGIEGTIGDSYTGEDQLITYIYEPITVVIPPKEEENPTTDPEPEPPVDPEPEKPVVDEGTTGGKDDDNEKEEVPVVDEGTTGGKKDDNEKDKEPVVEGKVVEKEKVVKDEVVVKPVNSENEQSELPQTGSTATETTIFGAILLAIAAFFGIRKRKPDTK